MRCRPSGPFTHREIERQIPRVAEFPYPTEKDAVYVEYGAKVVEAFGLTMSLDGPMKIAEDEVRAAFDNFFVEESPR